MPRRIDSDEEDSKPQKKKSKSAAKGKGSITKSKSTSKKGGKTVKKEQGSSIIEGWASRRAIDSLDVIEDVEDVSPKQKPQRPTFDVIDDIERVPAVAQLAVHKKKVAEVSNWIKEFPHHRKKLLVLSGPAGAGKSTTVLSIAQSLNVKVVEWINPVDDSKVTTQRDEVESMSRKFSTFLRNSQRYATLEEGSNQLILIQDLPNTIGSSLLVAEVRQLFRNAMKEFLLSSRVRFPVILIVTESEVGSGEDLGYSSSYRGEGLTVKGLLGDEILQHNGTTHITFNPIAKTIMLKALQSIRSFRSLSKGVLQQIIDTSAGDIRSAINCATLVAMRVHHTRRLSSDSTLLSTIEGREGGLDLFHAAGRIVYNKRYGDEADDPQLDVPNLPPHLSEWTRRQSKVDIDDLLTSVQTDISTLRLLVHQNFPQSCYTPEDIDAVSSTLSDTDFLFPTTTATSPVQERLAAYYTVGGVLLALPSPVAKRTEYMMKWPESTRIPKKIRERWDRFQTCVEGVNEFKGMKMEDLLLDVLPFWMVIDKGLSLKMKRGLQYICDFPLRGRRITVEMAVEDEEQVKVETEKVHSGGWLIDDDIEDD